MPLSFGCAILMLLLAPTASAGPWSYLKSHKTVLAADFLAGAAIAADAASSVHCQYVAPATCIETSGMLGRHPSAASTWGHASIFIGGFITANHLLWHFAPDAKTSHTQAKVVLGMLTMPIVVDEAFNVPQNVRTAERLSGARKRMR